MANNHTTPKRAPHDWAYPNVGNASVGSEGLADYEYAAPTAEGRQLIAQAGNLGREWARQAVQAFPPVTIHLPAADGSHYGMDLVPDNAVTMLAEAFASFAAEALCIWHRMGSERDLTHELFGPACEAAAAEFSHREWQACQ